MTKERPAIKQDGEGDGQHSEMWPFVLGGYGPETVRRIP
jgi:hypothetical protein